MPTPSPSPRHCDRCAVRGSWLFAGLDPVEAGRLTALAHPMPFQRRHILFSAGTASDHMLLLSEGVVKLLNSGEDGRAQILCLVYPGHLIGSEGFFRVDHEMTAEALTSGCACVLPRDRLMRTLRTCPEFALNLLEAVHEELDQARHRMQEMGKISAERKVCALLSNLLPHLEGEGPERSEFPLTHQDMADLLGLTRETVSRVIADLSKRGVFSLTRQRLCVPAPERLRQLAL